METPMDLLNLYCLSSRERFVPFADERVTDLVLRVKEICGPAYLTSRNGMWCMATPSEPSARVTSGWKLHVSVASHDYAVGVRLCAQTASEVGVSFKFIADHEVHRLSHSPSWSRSQSGKDIVLYPRSPGEARALAEVLRTRLMHLAPGPRVLSDLPFRDGRHVFYRYGAFERRLRCEPDGSHAWLLGEATSREDARNPWYVPPAGIPDPFVDDESAPPERDDGAGVLLAQRYRPLSAIKFTNAGGVYRARDLVVGGTVIIKEARPGVILPVNGWTAQYALRREHDLQASLDLEEWFAPPLDFFEQDGHSFFVQQDLREAHQLGQWSIARNPVYSLHGSFDDYLAGYRALIREIAAGLRHLHGQGVALGDLSFTNVVIDEDGRPRMVDFGGAFRPRDEDHPGTYTRGLGPSPKQRVGFERDVRALGYLMCGGVILPAGISELDPDAPLAMARVIADELGGHPHLDLARLCMQADAPSSMRLLETVIEGGMRDAPGPRRAQGTRPPRPRVGDVVRSLNRDDDTGGFRISPLAYERHPASLAWGCGGPLFVLGAIGARVPPRRYERWLATVRGSTLSLPPGLYTGWAGVAETALVCGDSETALWALGRSIADAEGLTDYSYWQGLAGISIACLDVARRVHHPELVDQATVLAERAYVSYEQTMPSEVRQGLAYGAAGVLLALCQRPILDRHQDNAALAELTRQVRSCVRRTRAGHLSCLPDPKKPHVFRHHLNDGSAGLASALARSYAATRCQDTRETIEGLLPDLDRLLTATPALWTGFSGLGMSLLDVAAALGRADIRRRAAGVADRLRVFQSADAKTFPGEQNLRLSDDLVAGSAGVLAFLWRAQEPQHRPNILPGLGG